MATTSSRFFSHPGLQKSQVFPVAAQKLEPDLVSVGGDGDSVFRSVAARIIDIALSSTKAKQPLIETLLELHSIYFPLPQSNHRLLTPAERLKSLATTPELLAKLVRELGYTLRQITVTELCAYPEYYQSAFSKKGPSPEGMRLPNTPIDKISIAALANALKLFIEVKVVEEKKELPMRLPYGPRIEEGFGDKLVMQLQAEQFIPQVMQVQRFNKVIDHPVSPSLSGSKPKPDPKWEDILKRIEAYNLDLVNSFETHVARLTLMVQDGEISKQDLLTIYIKSIGNSDLAGSGIKNAGVEHGTQKFFEEVIRSVKNPPPIIHLSKNSHDEQVTQELVNAISRAMSIGQLDEDKVYSQLEKEDCRKTAFKV